MRSGVQKLCCSDNPSDNPSGFIHTREATLSSENPMPLAFTKATLKNITQ